MWQSLKIQDCDTLITKVTEVIQDIIMYGPIIVSVKVLSHPSHCSFGGLVKVTGLVFGNLGTVCLSSGCLER